MAWPIWRTPAGSLLIKVFPRCFRLLEVCRMVSVLNRAGLPELECRLAGNLAHIRLKAGDVKDFTIGYGRLLFRQGRRWRATFKHLSADPPRPSETSHLSIEVPLRPAGRIVKSFNGIICAPAVKLNRPRRVDTWLMLFTPCELSSIAVSKPLLASGEASVQASLSVDGGALRCYLRAYGTDFRRAWLKLVRNVDTGFSLSHGFERITVEEGLCEVGPGAAVESEWRPVKTPPETLLVAMRSLPSISDVVALLRALGCRVRSIPFFGFWLVKSSYVAWDGEAITYRLRLEQGRKTVDEAELMLSW